MYSKYSWVIPLKDKKGKNKKTKNKKKKVQKILKKSNRKPN